jgi:hypothetical protein
MPEVLTYCCPFCDRDARVGEPCAGCVAKEASKRKKVAPAARNRKPRARESADEFDDGFDYEEFCKREFGKSPHHRTGLKWYWWCLAVMVLAGMTAAAFWIR